jgi:hypothetical protein
MHSVRKLYQFYNKNIILLCYCRLVDEDWVTIGWGGGGGTGQQDKQEVTQFTNTILFIRRSQWPRGLRPRSTAARLLRSWVRIHQGHRCLSVVSVVCCQVEVSATS